MAKVFISHRNVAEDLDLARSLHHGLGARGHQTFLDAVDLQLGDDWPMVIQKELESADLFVVLLSKHVAAHPDMVIEEVSMARELKRREGRPLIVPVCLGADVVETLPYDLAAMVKRVQYATWTGPRDTARILERLQRRLDGAAETEDDGVVAGPADFAPPRTRGYASYDSEALTLSVDERPPPQPPKARYSSYWYVPRTEAENMAEDFLREPGSPVVLVGPRDIGKSYLLDHLLETHCREADRQVRINLDLVDDEALETPDAFFEEIAFEVADKLQLDESAVDKAWERMKRRPAGSRLRSFLQRSALSAVEGRFFLVLDRADAIVSKTVAKPFFQELRRWAELGREEPWDRLRMMLAVSTEPGRLIDTLESSPFNISLPIRLDDLERAQLEELAECYGLLLRTEELSELMDLVGGHPYLVRKVLYQSAADNKPIAELLQKATASQGLFDDHLRSRVLKVSQDDELAEAVRLVLQGDRNPIDAEVAHRLLSSGLLTGGPGGYRMRYKLYDLYFRDWLVQ